MIPHITTCTQGNCRFGFPQFRTVQPDDLLKRLRGVEKDGADPKSYFSTTYKNVSDTLDMVSRAIAMIEEHKMVEACTLIFDFAEEQFANGQHAYMDSNYYIDLRGEIAEFIPCCR
jgi:hypothetical protein